MEGKVVVLLRTSSVARAPVYAHLRACGVVLVLVHPCAPAEAFGDVFAHWLCHDTNDVAALATALRAFLRSRALRPDAIVSFDEFAVYTAACLAAEHGLRAVPLPAEALRCTNVKSSFRLFCARHGIDAPAMRVLHRPPYWRALCAADASCVDTDDMRRRLEQHVVASLGALRLPVVLKPSPGAGSLLARLCGSVEEVCAHAMLAWRVLEEHPYTRHFHVLLQHTPGDTDTSKQDNVGDKSATATTPPPQQQHVCHSVAADKCTCCCSSSNTAAHDGGGGYSTACACAHAVELLLEEYVDGQEVDIDCAVEHGRVVFCAIADNDATRPPFFAEEGGVCPSRLDATAQCALRDLLFRFVAAHGAALHGVLHFEAKYSARQRRAVVIEVNCRLGSAETHTMVHTTYRGLHLGESLVRCALGLSVRAQLAAHYPECFMRVAHSAATVAQPGNGVCGHGDTNKCGSEADDGDDGTSAAVVTATTRTSEDAHTAVVAAVTAMQEGDVPCDTLPPSALGGAACGFFAPAAAAASVNVYPACAGVLRHVTVPHDDDALVAYSVAATAGDVVAPPPTSFTLLCWMVARAATAGQAVQHIRRLTRMLTQDIAPVQKDSDGDEVT